MREINNINSRSVLSVKSKFYSVISHLSVVRCDDIDERPDWLYHSMNSEIIPYIYQVYLFIYFHIPLLPENLNKSHMYTQ